MIARSETRSKSSLWGERIVAALLGLIPRRSNAGVWVWDRGDEFLKKFWIRNDFEKGEIP